MVATIRMFKFSASNKELVANVAGYYIDPTNASYYTESGEAPGEWYGGGAEKLRLTGVVTRESLFHLLRGMSPDGTQQLVRKRKKTDPKSKSTEHMPGFDMTFSVPKDVSDFWALATPDQRTIIERMVKDCAKKCLDLLQEQVPLIRRGKNGTRSEHGQLLAALFIHVTSRNNNDPNLHLHTVIPNIAVNNEGKTFKIDSKLLLKWTRTLGPLFRNELLCALNQEFGVDAYRPIVNGKEAGWFGLKGIPPKLSKHWSSRTTEILKQVELLGAHASDVTAQKAANLKTRRTKEGPPNRTELFKKWAIEAQQFGVTPQSMQAVIGRTVQIDIKERMAVAVETAIKDLTSSNATFERHEFIRAVSERLQDIPVTAEQVLQLVEHCLQHSQELMPIQRERGPVIFTTQTMWKAEEEIREGLDKLKATPGLAVSTNVQASVLQKHSKLTEEQQAAVKHILTSEGSISCMTGVAGSGKSTALAAVVAAYKLEGRRTIGIAMAGAAADNLQQKTGAESRTVASFLYHLEKPMSEKLGDTVKHHAKMFVREVQDQKTWSQSTFKLRKSDVVVLDEAAMLDSDLGKRIVAQVVKAGAKLIAVGDLEQLTPIGAGTPFRTMIEKAGSVHLAENFRMKNDPLGLEAAAKMREGQVGAALEIYAKRGDLTIRSTRAEAAQTLVSKWVKDGGVEHPERSMVLVHTRDEALAINRLCQDARLLEGKLSNVSVRVGPQDIHIGDRVMIKENTGLPWRPQRQHCDRHRYYGSGRA
ncbi:MAG: MobF family relaxase [Pirellulales bacterium]